MLMIFLFLFPIPLHALEAMSSEEIAIREEHDKIKQRLYECFAFHNVDPRNFDESVCREEQIEMKYISEKFNKFMRNKDAQTPLKTRRKNFKEFENKYKAYTESKLRDLHKENCQTKWGSSSSTECQAIASQLRRKQVDSLRKN